MHWRLNCGIGATFAAALVVVTQTSAAEEIVRVDDRNGLQRALENAKPGDRILLAPGTYAGGIAARNLQGTKDAPIVIASADAARPAVIEGGASGIQLSQVAWIEVRDLVIRGARGNGLNLDDGGRGDEPSRHVVLANLTIEDIGPQGNRDGIKLSGLDEFRVDGCRIRRWGSAGSAIDMVGCHQGLIVGCEFSHPDAEAANGVQTKGGSREITVRRCRFDRAGGRGVNLGGSTGAEFFRPRDAGYEARDITVEDCTFIGASAPVAFVGVEGGIVRHNTIYRPGRWGLRILQENTSPKMAPCRNGVFSHNIIAFRSDELRTMVNVGGGTSPETFTFAENVWYCLDRPESTERFVRLPVPEMAGRLGVDPGFRAADEGDLRLRPGGPARNAGVREE